MLASNEQLMKLKKVNAYQEKQFKDLHNPHHMQYKDAQTIAECHKKEKAVLKDTEVAMKTLQLNF